MPAHEKIDYVEFRANDFAAIEAFYGQVFGWSFEHYGDQYLAFANEGVDGGFIKSDAQASAGALVIFYSEALETTENKIVDAGGTIVRPTEHFPGGRRFHFTDPHGNKLDVWSDREADGTACP